MIKPEHTVSLVELGFMAARSQLLEVAAFLDRVERAGQTDDFRFQALVQALPVLENCNRKHGAGRVQALLNQWSDPSAEPVAAAHTKGASGAWHDTPLARESLLPADQP